MTKIETTTVSNNFDSQLHDRLIPAQTIEYYFPFMEDPRVISSLQRDAILELAGPESTAPAVEKAVAELEIHDSLSVTRIIPFDDQLWRIIPATGTACRTTSSTSVELLLDPNNPNTVQYLSSWGSRQIAHEFSHVARMELTPLHTNLLDALVSEGIGVYYEEHWGNEYAESHWGHVLDEHQLRREWENAQSELTSSTFDFSDWFYGRKDGHPIYAGYSLGNAIVRAFMETHPNTSIAELARLHSADLLKEGKFSI